jgi:hypothetical protein
MTQITNTETTQAHEHAFPVQPPEGSIWAPGRCRICGKTWELAQAEKAMAGALAAMEMAGRPPRPVIVCLCGSTRFGNFFRAANYELTLRGEIVLSIGCDTKSDEGLGITDEQKIMLDELHKRKIDMADYVLVVSDKSGYFGDSTSSEIQYAVEHGKPVRYAEPAAARRAEEMDLEL